MRLGKYRRYLPTSGLIDSHVKNLRITLHCLKRRYGQKSFGTFFRPLKRQRTKKSFDRVEDEGLFISTISLFLVEASKKLFTKVEGKHFKSQNQFIKLKPTRDMKNEELLSVKSIKSNRQYRSQEPAETTKIVRNLEIF